MPPVIAWAITAIATYAGVEVAAGSIIAGLITVASDAIFFGGLYLYNRQQALKAANRLAANSAQTLTVRQSAATRMIIYGTTRVGGVMVFAGTSGTKNEYLNMVVAHAGHQCNAVTRFFLNNDELFIDGSGNVTGATDQNGNATSKYNGFVRIEIFLGAAGQTYSTDLAAEIAAWDSTHKLSGICYTYWRFKYDTTVFNGGLPNVSVMVQGKLVYDPRTSSTSFSSNAALCLRDFLLDTALGLGASTSEVDDSAVITAANHCDEAVGLKAGGTESRYTINGAMDTATAAGGIIQDMCAAMAGICPYIGGQFRMLAGVYQSPVVSLSESDLRGSMSVMTRESRRTAYNSIKGIYVADANNWQTGDFPPIENTTYITEDNGDIIWRDIQLPLTTSPAMAQRIANIELLRSRRDKVVTFPAKLTAMNCQVGDNITLSIARYGWVNKVFEVTQWGFSIYTSADGKGQCLGIDLQLRETDSNVWAWNPATQEGVTLQTALPAFYNPQNVTAPSGLTLATSNVKQTDGTIQPRIHASWTVAADQFVLSGGGVVVQYKAHSSGTWITWGILPGDATDAYIDDVTTGVSYDVQIAFRNSWFALSAFTGGTYTVAAVNAAPATPSGLAATGNISGVSLKWTANSESDLRQYNIYRNTVNTFPGGTPYWSGNVTHYLDAYGAIGTTYYYWITASNTSGNESAQSSSVNGVHQTVASGLGNGDITTNLVAAGAIQKVYLAYSSAGQGTAANPGAGNFGTDVFQTVSSVVVTTGTDVVDCKGMLVCSALDNFTLQFDIRRGGVSIYSVSQKVQIGVNIIPIMFAEQPGAGTYNYTFTMTYPGSFYQVTTNSNRFLECAVIKAQ